MNTDPQKTIQEIIDLYLGEEHPDEHTQEQFRAWLAGDGHRKEKYEALEKRSKEKSGSIRPRAAKYWTRTGK